MSTKTHVILEVGGDAAASVLSPSVARVTLSVETGAVLQPYQWIGQIEVLGRRSPLVCPPKTPLMRVGEVLVQGAWSPVGYHQPLLVASTASVKDLVSVSGQTGAVELGLPDDARQFRAPIEGFFYTSPQPGEPPFVKVGDVVMPGQPVGVVEVMKFFYHVTFELEGFRDGGKIVHIAVQNETSVSAGDPLFYVTPI